MVELRRIFLRTVERGATSKSPEWQPFDANDLIRFEFEREGIERYSFIGRWIVGRWVVRLKRRPEELSVVVPGMGPAGPLRYKELALWAGYKAGEGLPEDLAAQFGLLEDVWEASGFTVWPMIHGEADDGLATGAVIAAVLVRYEHLEAIPRDAADWDVGVRGAAKLAERLVADWEAAILFRRLATLTTDSDEVTGGVDDWRWVGS